MNKAILDALKQSLPVQERKGAGNKIFKYVASNDIVDRMNTVFMGNWSVEVITQEVIEDNVVVKVRVSVIDPNDSKCLTFHQEGYASHQIFRHSYGDKQGQVIDIGNSFRSAMSKAIKAAVARWGVGLHLDDDDSENYSNTAPNPADSPGPAPVAPVPVKPVQPNTNGVTSTPTAPVAPVAPVAPTAPVVPTAPEVTNPSTPPATENTAPVPTFGAGMPGVAPTPQNNDASNTFPQATSVEVATDVQKVAIQTTMSLHNLTFEQLVDKVFVSGETKPASLDNLSYTEAVALISFGNRLNEGMVN